MNTQNTITSRSGKNFKNGLTSELTDLGLLLYNSIIKVGEIGVNTFIEFKDDITKELKDYLQNRFLNGITINLEKQNIVLINTPNENNKQIINQTLLIKKFMVVSVYEGCIQVDGRDRYVMLESGEGIYDTENEAMIRLTEMIKEERKNTSEMYFDIKPIYVK